MRVKSIQLSGNYFQEVPNGVIGDNPMIQGEQDAKNNIMDS